MEYMSIILTTLSGPDIFDHYLIVNIVFIWPSKSNSSDEDVQK